MKRKIDVTESKPFSTKLFQPLNQQTYTYTNSAHPIGNGKKNIHTWRKRSVRCKQRLIVISGARCNEGKAVISLFDKRTEVLIPAGWKNSGKGK